MPTCEGSKARLGETRSDEFEFRSRHAANTQLEFKKDDWTAAVPAGFDLVVSLQAVHELRHASRAPKLYAQLYTSSSRRKYFDLRSR